MDELSLFQQREGSRHRYFETDGKVLGKRSDQAGEIQAALARRQAVAARLADDFLHVGRPLGGSIAELRVVQLEALQFLEAIAGAEEVDGVDENRGIFLLDR